ncbi:hypothetical protein BJ166DRAFT_543473 [Pestalotiopsis sp. NC0098]|nr:hypothetical protein BJ166DRAFT_543473 [Pestalotiopsis sp. NC0098]
MLPPRSSSFWSSLLWWISSFSTWLIDDQTCWASTRPRADPPLASRLLFLFPNFEHDVWGQGILLLILLRGRQDNYPFPLDDPSPSARNSLDSSSWQKSKVCMSQRAAGA